MLHGEVEAIGRGHAACPPYLCATCVYASVLVQHQSSRWASGSASSETWPFQLTPFCITNSFLCISPFPAVSKDQVGLCLDSLDPLISFKVNGSREML